jgi:hypothetical protein
MASAFWPSSPLVLGTVGKLARWLDYAVEIPEWTRESRPCDTCPKSETSLFSFGAGVEKIVPPRLVNSAKEQTTIFGVHPGGLVFGRPFL